MRKKLNKDYAIMCNSSTVDPSSEFWFCDISKLAKDITDANKLTKKTHPTHTQPLWLLMEGGNLPKLDLKKFSGEHTASQLNLSCPLEFSDVTEKKPHSQNLG